MRGWTTRKRELEEFPGVRKLEFGVGVRADFAVEIDLFVLRGDPFHGCGSLENYFGYKGSIAYTGSGKKADCDVTEKLKREVAAMRVEYKCGAFQVARMSGAPPRKAGSHLKIVAVAWP